MALVYLIHFVNSHFSESQKKKLKIRKGRSVSVTMTSWHHLLYPGDAPVGPRHLPRQVHQTRWYLLTFHFSYIPSFFSLIICSRRTDVAPSRDFIWTTRDKTQMASSDAVNIETKRKKTYIVGWGRRQTVRIIECGFLDSLTGDIIFFPHTVDSVTLSTRFNFEASDKDISRFVCCDLLSWKFSYVSFDDISIQPGQKFYMCIVIVP